MKIRGWAAALLVCAALPAAGQEHLSTPSTLEGRPGAATQSPVQALIDRAEPGALVEVPAGTYVGDLVIDKPLWLLGRGRPRLVGSGTGSVVRVRASRVTVEGFTIDGRKGGDLGRDSSGVHIAGEDVLVRDCLIENALFGVYLLEANGSAVERSVIRGIPGRDPGEKGSGIHAYNTQRFRFAGNTLVDVRDALYLQNSSHGIIRGNRASDVRYGLHYMYSDDNVFEDNTFERSAAGAAVMYSKRIVFRRNRFLRNRGFASVGLLLQQCDDITAESNLIADNARGIFLEGTHRTRFSGNVVAGSDAAVVLFDSAQGAVFEGNAFFGNMTPLELIGRRTEARFDGNYWSDNAEPDLDGDGASDRPHRLSSVFDHMRGNLTAADLFTDSLGALALSAAERALPIIGPSPVVDARPLAAPPSLPDVPPPDPRQRRTRFAETGVALVALLTGGGVLAHGRRPRTGGAR